MSPGTQRLVLRDFAVRRAAAFFAAGFFTAGLRADARLVTGLAPFLGADLRRSVRFVALFAARPEARVASVLVLQIYRAVSRHPIANRPNSIRP